MKRRHFFGVGCLALLHLSAGASTAFAQGMAKDALPTGFGKVANNGAPLPDSAALGPAPSDWACTRHGPSGLVFEVKLAAAGLLRSAANTYSWRDTSSARNGGVEGAVNGGLCSGSGCDTQAYIAAVNSAALCGYSNWRLPTRSELQILLTLEGQGTGSPVAVPAYFPSMRADGYWTGSNFAANPEAAWVVQFDTGQTRWQPKARALHVLLVR